MDLLLVRRLAPWHRNAGKRLVKSPKTYVRDSGLVHALLGIGDAEQLAAHPIVGASWEGLVIESLIGAAPPGTDPYFYRSAAGAEIDLVLALPGGPLWAIEVKRSLAPKPEKGFHIACDDLAVDRRFVVYPGTESFPAARDVEAVGLPALCVMLDSLR